MAASTHRYAIDPWRTRRTHREHVLSGSVAGKRVRQRLAEEGDGAVAPSESTCFLKKCDALTLLGRDVLAEVEGDNGLREQIKMGYDSLNVKSKGKLDRLTKSAKEMTSLLDGACDALAAEKLKLGTATIETISQIEIDINAKVVELKTAVKVAKEALFL